MNYHYCTQPTFYIICDYTSIYIMTFVKYCLYLNTRRYDSKYNRAIYNDAVNIKKLYKN